MKKIILFLVLVIVFNLHAPLIVNSQLEQELPRKDIKLPTAELPQTIGEAELIGRDFLDYLPGEMEKQWYRAVIIWTNMYNWSFSFFNRYIKGFIQSIWNRIWRKSRETLKEKETILKKEFEKEKESVQETIQEETRKISKSIWQTILEKTGISKIKR